jgi:hypothetical protein
VTLRVRNSERKDFVRCRQRWYWGYIDLLSSRNRQPALEFGDLIHQALALWYVPGKSRKGRLQVHFQRVWKAANNGDFLVWIEEDDRVSAFELGMEMCSSYEAKYGKDSQFEIIAPEQPFQIEIYYEGEYVCTYVGTMDAVVRDLNTMKLGLFEHKTTGALPPRQWLPMDEQASTYWTFGTEWLQQEGHLKPGEDLDFILYNFLNKKRADTRPKNAEGLSLNQNGTVSRQQPPPLFYRELVYRDLDMRATMRERTIMQVLEMRLVREGHMAVYKNPTSDCKWDCQFKDMCELHERKAGWEMFRDAMFTKWEPYEVHLPMPTELTR